MLKKISALQRLKIKLTLGVRTVIFPIKENISELEFKPRPLALIDNDIPFR